MVNSMTPEWRAKILSMVASVREAAEKHSGWPVNVTYEGCPDGIDMAFKCVPMELPTDHRGRELVRPVGNTETGEYTFWIKRPWSTP